MYSITPPDSRFIEDDHDPATFSEGTRHLRHLLKWALAELDYQSQRGAIAISFYDPVDYLQFLTNEFNPRLLALHNMLPSLSSFPSDNTEADVYLRQKLRRSFEAVFEDFLAVNQRLFVSELPMFATNSPNKSGLLKQVATDFLSLWKGIFEHILRLTDDVQQVKAHANADGNVTLNLKIDAPASYQQLIDWLTEQARYAQYRSLTDNQKPPAQPEQDVPVIGNFAAGLVLLSMSLLGMWLFFHFWPTSLGVLLLLGFIWLFFKHPLYLLAIWLGFTVGS